MKKWTMGIGIALLFTQVPGTATAATPPVTTEKTNIFYIVGAHPDDEFNSWGFIEELDDSTYTVFVTLTMGEGTSSCHTKDESLKGDKDTEALSFVEGLEEHSNEAATGPYKYQGSGSPVDEPDHGEVHPLGDPWVGQSTAACKVARIASWHWFLDAMHGLDGTGTDLGIENDADLNVENDPYLDDDFGGTQCGHPIFGAQGKKMCADVWADENGARIAFDLGNTLYVPGPPGPDGDNFNDPLFSPDDATAAIEAVVEGGHQWGLPELPPTGMVSTSGYHKAEPTDSTDCEGDANPDHKLVQDAISGHDFGAGPQYGPLVCHADKYGGGHAESHFLIPTTLVDMQWVDACPSTVQPAGNLANHSCEERIGPWNRYYGWLFSTYMYDKPYDSFFKVFE